MRFVRNLALKEHLNAHFEQNLALKRRGDRTMAREQYQGFSDFVAPRKHISKQDGKYFLLTVVLSFSSYVRIKESIKSMSLC